MTEVPLQVEGNEDEPETIEVSRAIVELSLVKEFVEYLVLARGDEGKAAQTIAFSPNIYFDAGNDETGHFQMYPERYLKYLKGEVDFDELMGSVGFATTKNENLDHGDNSDWHPVGVKFTGPSLVSSFLSDTKGK